MSIITPNVNATASLSMPLITPGYPLVVVPSSSPVADVILKTEDRVNAVAPAGSATIQKVLVASGHTADRVV